ncbi:23 kDa integral membrane protein isoform X1 [Drosophila sulfurigaster albostrigata]|uniref:23 kDa integral membrane protein isoform X1 n=1 Tax=Drosophila sulfurigaster albostrigata TaxID=89887 RepID=UPI002D218CFE|nr:23 kDa integral membrane protein isoform X1 [Drosophila sulfurigaster albostrigata]
MKIITLEVLLWINHMQSVEFAFVGISLIMGGFYLPIDHSYMQVELVCYWTTSIRRMFVVCGIVLILAGALGAFWYRRHVEFFYLTQMLFIVLGIIFTIVLALFITYNCHIEKAKRRVEYLWLDTENDKNAFFMMQQHLKCCGKSGPEDYIDKEQFPVCHKDFNADDIKFTKGCIEAAEDFYNKKVMLTIVAMVAMIVDETKGLLLSIALYRCRVKIAAVAIRHNVTYITRRT